MKTEDIKALSHQIEAVKVIHSESEYNELIVLMDYLVEDSEKYAGLINLLFPVIERYEEEAEQFEGFNQRIKNLDSSVAMLRVIIDQHNLTLSDFPEIGKKSLMSKILNGRRRLTLDQVKAISNRFDVPLDMFISNASR